VEIYYASENSFDAAPMQQIFFLFGVVLVNAAEPQTTIRRNPQKMRQ